MEFTLHITDQDVLKQQEVTLFSPKNPAPEETVFLSNIDQAVAFPVEMVFFFDVSDREENKNDSTMDISVKIRQAVEEVLLVPYYFMAGRLRFHRETNRLELLCNNAGVLFVSATSKLRLIDLGNLSLPNPTFHHFVHRPGLYKSLQSTALFTIQVTRFACGGFSVGFVTNHAIVDGRSASEMFRNLASICRDEGLMNKFINVDRTCLKARNPPVISYPHKEYIKLTDLSGKNNVIASCFTAPEQPSPPPLIFSKTYARKLFSFSPEMINKLKKKSDYSMCSSFQALVAHIWVARAKAVFKNPEDMSTVLFSVDIRHKVTPPLPTGFVGNGVVTAFSTAKVSDLVEKPLSFGVQKLKEAGERVTDDYVRSVIDWLEINRGIPATCNGAFYVSAWCKLPFDELDFGFGKAQQGGPVASGNDEFVLLLSDGRSGGISVWLALEEDDMKRLLLHIFDI